MYFFFFFLVFYLILVFCVLNSFFFCSFVMNFFLFSLKGIDFSFSFVFDFISFSFFASVSFISSMVFLYSVFYMSGTVEMRRFYWLVFGFVISMALLVFSGNFLSLMIGWDGLGLISFCLVIFYSNYSSLESGLVTVFSNRLGDVFFLGSMLFLFMGNIGVVDFFDSLTSLLFVFLFLGAMTKSAQFPFSAWLPAAMSAPTPVSSLVHSSTLVTAGVYVLLRFHYLFTFFDMVFMKGFFIITMVVAGVCANLEKDFKKIVAMSTLSQLGMMMFILSVGVWFLSFMHMIIHAFFKSLLFMSTGSLMNNFSGGQDSRFYGGDFFSFGSFLCFVVSSVCLMGFPFFIGFYSKDLIIVSSGISLGAFFYLTFLLGCLLTIGYSFRIMKSSFSNYLMGVSYLCNYDMKIFMCSVFFLFLKCWVLGSVFFSLFFYDLNSTFSFFDLVVGLLLIFLSFFVFKMTNHAYFLSSCFYSIVFLRWFSSSGSSMVMPSMKNFRWDCSWSELWGGQGVYVFLSWFCFVDFYKVLSLSFLFVIFSILLMV